MAEPGREGEPLVGAGVSPGGCRGLPYALFNVQHAEHRIGNPALNIVEILYIRSAAPSSYIGCKFQMNLTG